MANIMNKNIPVDPHVVGFIVGNRGSTINMVKNQTGAHVQVRQANPSESRPWPWVHIRGFPHQVDEAEKWIMTIIAEGHTRSGTQPSTGTANVYNVEPQPVRYGYANGVTRIAQSGVAHIPYQGAMNAQHIPHQGAMNAQHRPPPTRFQTDNDFPPIVSHPQTSAQIPKEYLPSSNWDGNSTWGGLTEAQIRKVRDEIAEEIRLEHIAAMDAHHCEITPEMLRPGETIEDAEAQDAEYAPGAAFELSDIIDNERVSFDREIRARAGPQIDDNN